MKKETIYFDNAATTALDPEVLVEMMPFLTNVYGNGSSIHGMGRKAKSAVENARKKVAEILNASPAEIFFTSGGTEANNTVLHGVINDLKIQTIIASPIEHHAILQPSAHMAAMGTVDFKLVRISDSGQIDFNHLEELLEQSPSALVCLMHGNNEIGNILDLNKVSDLCFKYKALFHSDMVQTIGKIPVDLQKVPVDFICGSAHKFHGPKGVGFLYIKSGIKLDPYLLGGAQERNMRGGTENVAGIVGLAKALELALTNQESRKKKILKLKIYIKEQLEKHFSGIGFNGMSGDLENSLYHIINVSFPPHPDNEMLLFNLDIEGICLSGGSACSSGTDIGSHVLKALDADSERANVRFSFSRLNTTEEIDRAISVLNQVFNK